MSSPLPTLAATDAADRTAAIRTLNDRLRQSFSGGRVVITAGLAALAPDTVAAILAAVKAFDRFNSANDPHDEHDFGAVTAGGKQAYWKIDYLDQDLQYHSPDTADPAVTVRVLTVMLPEEY